MKKMRRQILVGLIMFIVSISSNTARAQEEIVYSSGIDAQKNTLCETPKSGNISFSVEKKDGCPVTKYIIYAQNLSTELGISYSWQFFSTKDQKWKDLPNENLTQLIIIDDGKNYSTTYYRLKSTCHKNGLSSYSNKLLIL